MTNTGYDRMMNYLYLTHRCCSDQTFMVAPQSVRGEPPARLPLKLGPILRGLARRTHALLQVPRLH